MAPSDAFRQRSIGTAQDSVRFWVHALRSIEDIKTMQSSSDSIHLTSLTAYLLLEEKATEQHDLLSNLTILSVRLLSVCTHLFDLIDNGQCDLLRNPSPEMLSKLTVWDRNVPSCIVAKKSYPKLIHGWNIASKAISTFVEQNVRSAQCSTSMNVLKHTAHKWS